MVAAPVVPAVVVVPVVPTVVLVQVVPTVVVAPSSIPRVDSALLRDSAPSRITKKCASPLATVAAAPPPPNASMDASAVGAATRTVKSGCLDPLCRFGQHETPCT